jgi:septal ring factor EnvC (AmiA/AmiB activator)
MSISPGYVTPPEPPKYEPPQQAEQTFSRFNWFPPIVIIILVMLAVGNFLVYSNLSDTRKNLEQKVADLKDQNAVLERRLAAADERHNELRGQVVVTQEKLGTTARDLERARAIAKQLSEEQKAAESKLGQQIGQVGQQVGALREESGQKIAAVGTEVAGAKTDIAATRKDLEQTKTQLMTAIGDITKANTLIARNHDEVSELRRRGERNYVEFDLPKEKQPRRVGDISIQLRSADPKKQKYSILVVADDAKNEKKDKTLYEPVQFYMGRTRALYEIVVNKVSKDRIAGYLATPRQ